MKTLTQLDVRGMRVALARRFWPRLVGLLGRRRMARDEALLLLPCTNIHTFFMRFAIDAVFLDRDGAVVAIFPRLRPWRVAAARRAHACLELPVGGVRRFGLQVGQTIPQLAARSLAGR